MSLELKDFISSSEEEQEELGSNFSNAEILEPPTRRDSRPNSLVASPSTTQNPFESIGETTSEGIDARDTTLQSWDPERLNTDQTDQPNDVENRLQAHLVLQPNHTGHRVTIVCGPLLRYWGMNNSRWFGSALYVTEDEGSDYTKMTDFMVSHRPVAPRRIYQEMGVSFWRYDFDIDLDEEAHEYVYGLHGEHKEYRFVVPAASETMTTLFYTGNGFTLNTRVGEFPASLWTDVMRRHNSHPFNVMIGGGDQIFCDDLIEEVRAIEKQPFKRSPRGMSGETESAMERRLLQNYLNWYGHGTWRGPTGVTEHPDWPAAVASIPMVNMYNDHEILDGYGSFSASVMRSDFFRKLGTKAHKYYLLFQHALAPVNEDPKANDPCYVVSSKLGPFIDFPARSIYTRLGRSVACYALDCRTERTRNSVCSSESYKKMFERLESELASNTEVRHVMLVLSTPITYPRMPWIETVMSNSFLKPIRWLARKGYIYKKFRNDYDNHIEIFDDLNDQWCVRAHRRERHQLISRLQQLALKFHARVTIFSGDVHLAAVGRFRSVEKMNPEFDHRLIICPISSGITTATPPEALADFIDKRNKLRYLGLETVEDLIKLFNEDIDGSYRKNQTTMPRRNYCIIEEATGVESRLDTDDERNLDDFAGSLFSSARGDKAPPRLRSGSLTVTLRLERDPYDAEAETVGYRCVVPLLEQSPL